MLPFKLMVRQVRAFSDDILQFLGLRALPLLAAPRPPRRRRRSCRRRRQPPARSWSRETRSPLGSSGGGGGGGAAADGGGLPRRATAGAWSPGGPQRSRWGADTAPASAPGTRALGSRSGALSRGGILERENQRSYQHIAFQLTIAINL